MRAFLVIALLAAAALAAPSDAVDAATAAAAAVVDADAPKGTPEWAKKLKKSVKEEMHAVGEKIEKVGGHIKEKLKVRRRRPLAARVAACLRGGGARARAEEKESRPRARASPLFPPHRPACALSAPARVRRRCARRPRRPARRPRSAPRR